MESEGEAPRLKNPDNFAIKFRHHYGLSTNARKAWGADEYSGKSLTITKPITRYHQRVVYRIGANRGGHGWMYHFNVKEYGDRGLEGFGLTTPGITADFGIEKRGARWWRTHENSPSTGTENRTLGVMIHPLV